MEEDQELKHVCKFCDKSFSSGRSLGGHMRSHVINSTETDEKHCKKKVKSVNNGGNSAKAVVGVDNGGHTNYGLRKNPKQTCRFADSKEDTLLHDKLCKECGKGFQSWKALFGHMKCHSQRVLNSVEEDSSWTNANQKQLVMYIQSDNETAAPNRKTRSRRSKRYIATAATTSSSFSVANVSPSVSEIEQEQEEVALCLIMLSRDVSGINSLGELSDNNSEFLEVPSSSRSIVVSTKIEAKNTSYDVTEFLNFKKLKNGKSESSVLDCETMKSKVKESEFNASVNDRTGAKIDGFLGNHKATKLEVDNKFRVSETELRKNMVKKEAELDQPELSSKKCKSSKRKCIDLPDPQVAVNYLKDLASGVSGSEMNKDTQMKSKFECTTCNKAFHSFQALGGHRASHKKIKGCFASKIDSNEYSFETELSPGPTADSKLIKSCSIDVPNPIKREIMASVAEMFEASKKNKERECPICFKVFSSGQALGGHKRSHLIGNSESKTNHTIVIQKPIPETRNFLDLNLPAPVEDESGDHVAFNPWWIGSNHKQEPLVGLF